MKCPKCNKKINWSQKWQFTKGLCSRKVSACPNCGVKLIYAKLPHRLMNIGVTLLILGTCSKYFFPYIIAGKYSMFLLCYILACLLIFFGIVKAKFNVLNEIKT